jgi:hypothetical protein
MTERSNDATHQPHVFVEKDVPLMSMIAGDRGKVVPDGPVTGVAAVCGLCLKPRADRIHIEGQAEADAEMKWG